MKNQDSRNLVTGINAGIAASLMWGTYPLWYRPLSHIHTYELLANRIIWSLVFVFPLVFLVYRKGKEFKAVFRNMANLPIVCVCAAILALWWFTYMYCVTNNRVLEAGLGYYLGPIFTVGMGAIFLRERIDRWSAIAVLTSFAGIAYYAVSTQGEFPVFAIILGLCYSGYTVYKRSYLKIDSQVSVAIELLMLLPCAIAIFFYQANAGQLRTFVSTSMTDNVLLFMLGVINVLPMWWYTVATKNLPTVSMSFIQYISPTCNFLLAVFWFKEPFSTHSLVMFALVWLGVAIYTVKSVWNMRAGARLAVAR